MRYFLSLLILAALSACAEDDVLHGLIKKLDAEDYVERQLAQESIQRYFYDNPKLRWDIGRTLLAEKANPEVQSRIETIVHTIEKIDPLSASNHDDPLQDVTPGFGDKNKIGDFPVIISVITSIEMMQFYRKVAQSNRSQEMPKTDFKNTILFAIIAADGPYSYIKELSFKRDFQEKTSKCQIVVGAAQEGIAAKFSLSRLDLPVTVSGKLEHSDTTICVVRLDESTTVTLENVQTVLEDRNILGLRKLAELIGANMPAEARREFLRRSYPIDPLMPYVMFMHLAKKHPSTFREDYEYWKNKLPDSPLEAGKRIVDNTK